MGQVIQLTNLSQLSQYCTKQRNYPSAVLVAVKYRFDYFVSLDEILFSELLFSLDQQ